MNANATLFKSSLGIDRLVQKHRKTISFHYIYFLASLWSPLCSLGGMPVSAAVIAAMRHIFTIRFRRAIAAVLAVA